MVNHRVPRTHSLKSFSERCMTRVSWEFFCIFHLLYNSKLKRICQVTTLLSFMAGFNFVGKPLGAGPELALHTLLTVNAN